MDNSVLEPKPTFFALQQDINRCHTWAGSTNWSNSCVTDGRNKWGYNGSNFNLTCIDWVDKWLAYTGLLFWIKYTSQNVMSLKFTSTKRNQIGRYHLNVQINVLVYKEVCKTEE